MRIPKNRPLLKCSICECTKHYRCNGLTKMEAFDIIENCPDWSCQDCIFSILPVNLLLNTHVHGNSLEQCYACSKKINSSAAVATCTWCDGRCHKTCLNGPLGCKICCDKIIPGVNVYARELFDAT